MQMTMRVLIVDDEPLARLRIRDLLKKEPDVGRIVEAANGLEAVSTIREQTPDLVFLDVQMPEMDGFEVLGAMDNERMPQIIFVTAYDQYAIRAFEVHALDYLLKPFDRDRFQKALQRVREQIRLERNGDFQSRLQELLDDIKPEKRYVGRLVVKSGGKMFFLKTDEIDWVEAAGNYVVLHVGREEHLLRETMNGLEQKLDPEKFIRIHRSKIVNIERIQEMKPWFSGEYLILLKDGTKLALSRKYREKMKDRFQDCF